MAETFNRASAAVTTSAAAVYTAPNGAATDRAVVLSTLIANIDGTAAATVNAYITDNAGTAIAGGHIANTISVPAGSSLELIANKLVLKAGEKIFVQASANGDLTATVSVLEIN